MIGSILHVVYLFLIACGVLFLVSAVWVAVQLWNAPDMGDDE